MDLKKGKRKNIGLGPIMGLTSQLNVEKSFQYMCFKFTPGLFQRNSCLHNRDFDNGLGVCQNYKSSGDLKIKCPFHWCAK